MPYTYLQLKFKEGDQEHTTWAHPYYIFEGSNKFILPPVGTPEASSDVIRKIGAKSRLSFPGLDHFDHVEYGPFEIAKREVTNAEFLEFVQQGGYNTDEGWDCPIEYQGRMLDCDELRSMLVDETDMPGPPIGATESRPEAKRTIRYRVCHGSKPWRSPVSRA